MPTPNIAGALPSTNFITGRFLYGAPLPIVIPGDTQVPLPSYTRAIDFSGFNTLSNMITVSGISGGDHLNMDLLVEDPETGTITPFPIGFARLQTLGTDGTYGGTLYLPAYYAANPANMMPFYQNLIQLRHDGSGGGDITVSALKFWLSNA